MKFAENRFFCSSDFSVILEVISIHGPDLYGTLRGDVPSNRISSFYAIFKTKDDCEAIFFQRKDGMIDLIRADG